MQENLVENYDAVAVLGKAYDFEKQCFPDHFYQSLREAASVYHAGRTPGGIAVCGAADMKALERGLVPPCTEAEEGFDYLVRKMDIPPDMIRLDNLSTNTPDNFINLKTIALREEWLRILMPLPEARAKRAAFLGQKICYDLCDIQVKSFEWDLVLPTEAKLLGDMACTLKDMKWGDDSYLIDREDGTPLWNKLRTDHHTCKFYVPTDNCEPFRDFHPEALTLAYTTPPKYS